MYPGSRKTEVEIYPGNLPCPVVPLKSAHCTFNITSDNEYNVNITQTNDNGNTVNDTFKFNCEPLQLRIDYI